MNHIHPGIPTKIRHEDPRQGASPNGDGDGDGIFYHVPWRDFTAEYRWSPGVMMMRMMCYDVFLSVFFSKKSVYT